MAAASSETYDYIIVGGGTAGCVLANRLSADESKKVLVIEAGNSNFEEKRIKIPSGVLRLFKSDYDWDFKSVSEASVGDREIYLCRGKVLGGSSCINVSLYNRGDAHDYKAWAELSGSDDWSPDNVLPHFKKSENHFNGESTYHGATGEVTISQVPYQNPLSKAFLESCEDSGLKANDDFNDWSVPQEGYGRFHVFQKNGVRVSAASAFLKPVATRSNLNVVTDAYVSKVNIDTGKGENVATGVSYVKDGKVEQVFVSKAGEVLLTGGAINSPQILMLSGIGPKEELQKLGIDVVRDLPGVGRNLQDHPAVVLSYGCKPGNEGVSVSSKMRMMRGLSLPSPKALLQWFLKGEGPLTTTGCDHGALVKTVDSLPSPDLQLRFIAARAISPDGMNTLTQFKKAKNLQDGFSIQSLAVRPMSVGAVSLKSADPFEKPLIRTGFLTNKDDMATLRAGIRMARKIAQSHVFDKFRGEEVYPGPQVQSNDQLDEYIRSTVHTANALVGTCKMGMDSMSVVDPHLRVHGVKALRVVDSSVMPKLPGGQGASPTLMIAEKAAAFITQ